MFKKHVYFFRRRQQLAEAPSDTWVARAVTAERDAPANGRALRKVAVGHASAVLQAGQSPARAQAAAGAVPKPGGPSACACYAALVGKASERPHKRAEVTGGRIASSGS